MEVSIKVVEWKLEQEAKEDLFEEVIVSSSHINRFLCHTNILWEQTRGCPGSSRETWNRAPGWGSLAETREQTSWEKEERSRGEGPGIAQSQVLQAVVRVIAHGNKKEINRMRNGVQPCTRSGWSHSPQAPPRLGEGRSKGAWQKIISYPSQSQNPGQSEDKDFFCLFVFN